jgi:O-antigen ligase
VDTSGRLHLVAILGFMGVLALFASGAMPRTFTAPQGVWLSLFTGWLIFSLPFSTWRGESFRDLTGMWLKSYVAYFLVAGLIFTVDQCRRAVFWLAFATVAVIYYALRTGVNSAEDSRFAVTYGTLGNANDLAGALLMGLPFLIYVIADKRRNGFIRVISLGMALVLLVVVLRTGSRGAIMTIGALIILGFFKTNAANKMKIVVICGVLAVTFPLVVSRTMMARYATIFKSDGGGSADVQSAVNSTNARRELMKQGVRLTLRYPVFGVGLGNFSNKSADLFMARGEAPMWFTCHDIYLLVSSETGIIGFIIYMTIIVLCMKTLMRLQKDTRQIPELEEISNLSLCVMASLWTFLICGIFSTSAYSTQLPLIAGLTAALSHAAAPVIQGLKEQQNQVLAAMPNPYFPRSIVRR